EIQQLTGKNGLFETAFNFVNFHLYEELIASGRVRVLGYQAHENTTFGLMANFVLSPLSQRLSLEFEYDAQQIAAEQVAQIARAHVLALTALAQDVYGDPRQTCLLGDDE